MKSQGWASTPSGISLKKYNAISADRSDVGRGSLSIAGAIAQTSSPVAHKHSKWINCHDLVRCPHCSARIALRNLTRHLRDRHKTTPQAAFAFLEPTRRRA
jgi:hypothetical protein